MDEIRNVEKNSFGGIVFSIDVEHSCIEIRTIANSFLYWTSQESTANCLPWTKWSRAEAIEGLKYWLMHEGSQADGSDAYPEYRQLYWGMALRFAEELFPELVFDYQEYERRWDEFRQKSLRKTE